MARNTNRIIHKIIQRLLYSESKILVDGIQPEEWISVPRMGNASVTQIYAKNVSVTLPC
jgi:hypothetical protein